MGSEGVRQPPHVHARYRVAIFLINEYVFKYTGILNILAFIDYVYYCYSNFILWFGVCGWIYGVEMFIFYFGGHSFAIMVGVFKNYGGCQILNKEILTYVL